MNIFAFSEKFEGMSITEKRKLYRCGKNYVTLDAIKIWPETFDQCVKEKKIIQSGLKSTPIILKIFSFFFCCCRIVSGLVNNQIALFLCKKTEVHLKAFICDHINFPKKCPQNKVFSINIYIHTN